MDTVRVSADPEGCHLFVSVAALGTAPVTVPQVLIAAYDAAGVPVWVQDGYLPYALRPGRVGDLALTLPDLTDLRVRDVPLGLSTNGLMTDPQDAGLPPDAVPAPEGCGAAWIAVTPNGYRAAS